jgi:hypothetical protein
LVNKQLVFSFFTRQPSFLTGLKYGEFFKLEYFMLLEKYFIVDGCTNLLFLSINARKERLVVGSHTFLCKPKLKPIIGKNKKLIRKGI